MLITIYCLPGFYARKWYSVGIGAFTVYWHCLNGLFVSQFACSAYEKFTVLLFFICGDRRIISRFCFQKDDTIIDEVWVSVTNKSIKGANWF